MPTSISANVNVDTLNVLYINTAEQSFFETAFGQVVGGVLSTLGGDAVDAVLGFIFGNSDPDAAMLTSISNQLADLQGEIAGIAMDTVYQEAMGYIKNQITAMNKQVLLPVSSLTTTNVSEMTTFISPGTGAAEFTDYSSCVDNLLGVTYAVNAAAMVAANAAQKTCAMGTASACYAQSLNNNMLQAANGTEITTYVNTHMNLASTVSSLILGICISANQVYQYLKTNQAAIKTKFSANQTLLNNLATALQPDQIQATEIGNASASSFLPLQLAQQFAIAPSSLCGNAYTLVSAMVNNCSTTAAGINTNVTVSNGNGSIGPDSYNGTWWTLEYNSPHVYWRIFYVNNTPSSALVQLEGYNGGYLGFLDIHPAYVYEVMQTSQSATVAPTPVISEPTNQWQMLVKSNGANMVYMFLNAGPGKLALANNHGVFESTQPGQFGFDGSNADQYWNVTMQY